MSHHRPSPKGKPFLSNRNYDVLKNLTQLWLPAFGTLYFTLAGIWGLPAADEVVGTVVAVDTFLGVFLGLSSKNYDSTASGTIVVARSDEGEIEGYSMELDEDPVALAEKDEVRFKVQEK